MTHCKNAAILFFLLLFLSACGSGEADQLREDNDALQSQVTAVEEERDELQRQVTALEGEKTALQEQIDSLQTELEQLRGGTERNRRENNPIDPFYDKMDMETGGTTVAMAAVACGRAGAWELETRNAAEKLKAWLPLQEDQDLVDAYIAAAEEQAGRMDIMAIFPVSDLKTPYPERIGTSGSLRSILWGERWADIWRDTFYQLYWIMPDSLVGSGPDYTFVFDAEATQQELDKWMK